MSDTTADKGAAHPSDIPIRRTASSYQAGKSLVTLRLSKSVLVHFRGTGAGWQARINKTLERAVAKSSKARPDSLKSVDGALPPD